jgi:hypothetical protein
VPRPSTFPLYDRLMGGGLADLLTEWKAAGASYEAIAERLRNEYDIQVTTSTVFRWMQPEEAAS